jgi:8-oxo-dGTP pyrophosphatase MutT (NUDIX family)
MRWTQVIDRREPHAVVLRVPFSIKGIVLRFFTHTARAPSGERLPIQVGALPWRMSHSGRDVELLLITSRSSGKWIIPKGWPMRGRTAPEAAAIEAFEEAGVQGRIELNPVGSFVYLKNHPILGRLKFMLLVYPLAVDRCVEEWPEQRQRTRQWVEISAAMRLVESEGLRAVMQKFKANFPHG